jgi:hypothetical protein
MEQWWNDDYQGKTEELGQNPASMLLHPLQSSFVFTWD